MLFPHIYQISDNRCVINKYLYPIDIIHACKPLNLSFNIKEHLAYTIDQRLDQYIGKENKELMKKLMYDHKAVISGSFILQCFYGEEWTPSDIDIYVPVLNQTLLLLHDGKPATELDKFIYHASKKMTTEWSTTIRNCDIYEMHQNFIDYIREYKTCNNMTFQTIAINIEPSYDNMLDFIDEYFDLDICKNMFYYDKDGRAKVEIYNETYLKTRETISNTNTWATIKRYFKYKKRGFKIQNFNVVEIVKRLIPITSNLNFDEKLLQKYLRYFQEMKYGFMTYRVVSYYSKQDFEERYTDIENECIEHIGSVSISYLERLQDLCNGEDVYYPRIAVYTPKISENPNFHFNSDYY